MPRFPRTDDGIPIGSHGFPVGISGSHVGTAPRLSFPLWVTDHYGMAPSLGPPAGIASLRFSTVPQFPPWAAGSRDSTAPPLPLCGTAPSPGFPVAVRGPHSPALCLSFPAWVTGPYGVTEPHLPHSWNGAATGAWLAEATPTPALAVYPVIKRRSGTLIGQRAVNHPGRPPPCAGHGDVTAKRPVALATARMCRK